MTIAGVQQPPKILFVTSNEGEVGGADLSLFRTAHAIARAGFRVEVLQRRPNRFLARYKQAGIKASFSDFHRPTKQGNVFAGMAQIARSLAGVIRLVRLVRAAGADIVHVNDLIDLLPAVAARLSGRKVVYHLRMIRGGAWQRRLMHHIITIVSHVSVCVSTSVQTAYGLDRTPARHVSRVIYNWPDTTLQTFQRPKCPEDYRAYGRRVLMSGRLQMWKGQAVFVEAVSLLRARYPDVGFFMAGGIASGHEEQRHYERVLHRARTVGVVYLGHRNDVMSLLSWSDVSVHASIEPDPLPNVVLESLYLGVPTVGTKGGGVPEMIIPEETGLLVEPRDAAGLAKAISRLLDEASLRATVSASGRRHIERLCNEGSAMQSLCEIYRTLASPPGWPVAVLSAP